MIAAMGSKNEKFPASIGTNKKNIATATPAPELIPIIPGSARSFRVMLCKMAPDKARAIPDNNVMISLGNRMEYKINDSLNSPLQSSVGKMRLYFILDKPVLILMIIVPINIKHRPIIVTLCFLIAERSIMRNLRLYV